jgi:hypothetical protein
MSRQLNRRIVAELDTLVAQKILSPAEARSIGERYPTTAWDILVLVRWFTILGAVAAGAGLVILANEYINGIRLGEIGLAATAAGAVVLARYLARSKGLVKVGAALEMMGGFALQGLTFLLAIDFSHGSKNWPALVGVQAALLAVMAYGLKNRLILIHAAVCFFVFFGGETGYVSGWGMYWMEMTYPLRFLSAGLVFVVVAWLHAVELKGPYQAFSRVYGHLGLLIIHLALWFLSIFGYFGSEVRWNAGPAEQIMFSFLWALVSLACLWLAGVTGQRMLRSYGLIFLIVDLYTFYFQFVVFKTAEAWWLHLLLVGGSLIWVGFMLERQLRGGRAKPESPSPESQQQTGTGSSG